MTPEQRQQSIDATATERASTLTPPVKHATVADLHKRVAELEGKPFEGDPANEFHLAGRSLREIHGERRSRLIEKLSQAALISPEFVPLFLQILDEYEREGGSDDAITFDGSGSEKYQHNGDWTSVRGEGLAYPGDIPTQEQADAIAAQAKEEMEYRKQYTALDGKPTADGSQGEFEVAAAESANVDVRPSEEKTNG